MIIRQRDPVHIISTDQYGVVISLGLLFYEDGTPKFVKVLINVSDEKGASSSIEIVVDGYDCNVIR